MFHFILLNDQPLYASSFIQNISIYNTGTLKSTSWLIYSKYTDKSKYNSTIVHSPARLCNNSYYVSKRTIKFRKRRQSKISASTSLMDFASWLWNLKIIKLNRFDITLLLIHVKVNEINNNFFKIALHLKTMC